MSERRVLRRIFGPKQDEVIGGWKKMHNRKLCTPRKIKLE
jgi:hypothetical protein